MTEHFDHEQYLSPFTWRYGTPKMRRIWSLKYKRLLWRRIWVALAEAQAQAGLVSAEQVADLRAHQDDINIARAHELERQLHHDLMAEVHTYAEQCPIGGGIIHLGATSMDIEDNADALILRESVMLLRDDLRQLLAELADAIEREAECVCMAFTHLQPAEPTTVGYRLAGYAQDLLADYENLEKLIAHIRGKGFKGAVGTAASYTELLRHSDVSPQQLEAMVMDKLGLAPYLITTQTYPRRQDWEVANALAGLAMSLYKLAFDLRLLQSPPIGEWAEPFGERQIGSSAMPFKRNPIHAENIDSLARFVAGLPRVLWDNAAHSLLERTLDDSANRRVVLPEAFLAASELLTRTQRLVRGLQLDRRAIARNLETYGVFAATERLLMAAARAGADRQELHEVIREHSMTAWSVLREGGQNPLAMLLSSDARITAYIPMDEIPNLLSAWNYVGDAPARARKMSDYIRQTIR